MQDERELTVELERERGGGEIAPIRVAPDDLEPDTLRAVIESFVLREGTDYGVDETSLDDKVAQVLIQLRHGQAHITFDPATESINVVVTSAISGSGRVTPVVNDRLRIEPARSVRLGTAVPDRRRAVLPSSPIRTAR